MNDMKQTGENSNGQPPPMILIVDDIPKNLQVLAGTLKGEYCQIAAATNGRRAMEMMEKIVPDLILLDVMMPEMDGFEVCKRLKEMPGRDVIPIIFLTARTETEDIVKGFRLGAADYITKPFNSEELLARVRMQLELKKSRDSEKHLIEELKEALTKVKQLTGMLPMCSSCKKIRDDDGYWQQVETYVREHSDVEFSHSLCPDCVRKIYPQMADELLKEE